MMSAVNILVIDDEANLRATLSMILRRGGYAVALAEDGKAARKLLDVHSFSLVLLDLTLPDIDGIDLLKEIRERHPDLPVLMLTGNASRDTSIQAIRQGARDYMIKPIEPDYILVRIKEILQENQQPKRRRELTRMIQDLMAELNDLDEDNPSSSRELQSLSPADPNRFIQVGKLSLDLHSRHCFLNGQFIQIPSSTFDYLSVLARHSPEEVNFETLVFEAQGYRMTRVEASEMARWQIHELRKALEPDSSRPTMIITVRNVGYRLVM